jgi:hypothetical protein
MLVKKKIHFSLDFISFKLAISAKVMALKNLISYYGTALWAKYTPGIKSSKF